MNPSLIVNLQLLERNMRNLILRRQHRFHYDAATQSYFCQEGEIRHYFGNRRRGFSLYRKGLKVRGQVLASSYCVEHIQFCETDLVIDCGANYGDLWLFLKGKIRPENYITFEPGKQEHQSITKNAVKGQHFNQALGNKNGMQKFFIQHKHADSSLIEPPEYEKAEECEVVRLDSFTAQHRIKRIKLLKLEAEGFEPEILDGATETLQTIDYVSLDGGYERGVEQAETLSACANHLFTLGFRVKSINWFTHRALFANDSH